MIWAFISATLTWLFLAISRGETVKVSEAISSSLTRFPGGLTSNIPDSSPGEVSGVCEILESWKSADLGGQKFRISVFHIVATPNSGPWRGHLEGPSTLCRLKAHRGAPRAVPQKRTWLGHRKSPRRPCGRPLQCRTCF